ncbi:hypothetical protein HQ520_17130 [bacterium]|nr:hypothetical protein [bacterium]
MTGEKRVLSQPALPWYVNRDYDTLKKMAIPDKSRNLSCVASSETNRVGKLRRVQFLQALGREVDFDLFGQGFSSLVDKWDGVAPYRYSLAIENHSGPWYWTEKLSDCFLAWTMPIYYGCMNLAEFFPPESYIQIDIQSADAIDQVKEALRSDKWIRNRNAIAYARELVLERHQFFPYVASLVEKESNMTESAPGDILLPALPNLYPRPRKEKVRRLIRRLLPF